MKDQALRVLAIGAHPDDCEFKAGGTAALYAQEGHVCKFVSLTNGDAGHYRQGGAILAQRRYAEAQASAAVAGIQYDVLDIHDEELIPSLENRQRVLRIIREFRPDLILTHRPNDYHPDHRYTSTLVQDAAYVVTVAGTLGLTEHMRVNPAVVYFSDGFQRPYPFIADVVVAIDSVVEKKLEMLHCHESQMYEWLPYNGFFSEDPPQDHARQSEWLRQQLDPVLRQDADRYRQKLVQYYGQKDGSAIRYAEAFEGCEYGAPLTRESIRRLFPFIYN